MGDEQAENVLQIVSVLRERQASEDAVEWVLLQQALDPARGVEPIIRHPKLAPLLADAFHSPSLPLKQLAFKQIKQQMPFPGARDFVLQLPQFPDIVRALQDENETIAAYAEEILVDAGRAVLEQHASVLEDIARASDVGLVRVYSMLYRMTLKNGAEAYALLVQGGWVTRMHERTTLNERTDPLIMLNVLEIQLQFFRGLQDESIAPALRALVWGEEASHILHLCDTLSSQRDALPMIDLYLPVLLQLVGEGLHLYLLQCHSPSDGSVEEKFAHTLESLVAENAPPLDDSVAEALIHATGKFSLSLPSQKRLFPHVALFRFFQEALLGPKNYYLAFLETLTQALHRSAGGEAGTAFCIEAMRGDSAIHRMEIVLKYAGSPYVDEREIVYKFFQQLAAVRFGRDWMYSTPGLLLWLTDRNLMVEANPEALWRYSILQQLVAIPEHCTEKLGQHGYLRIREYLSEGPYYLPPESRPTVADQYD